MACKALHNLASPTSSDLTYLIYLIIWPLSSYSLEARPLLPNMGATSYTWLFKLKTELKISSLVT